MISNDLTHFNNIAHHLFIGEALTLTLLKRVPTIVVDIRVYPYMKFKLKLHSNGNFKVKNINLVCLIQQLLLSPI